MKYGSHKSKAEISSAKQHVGQASTVYVRGEASCGDSPS